MPDLITVGLPVFNAMPYLPQTIESLLKQDYADFTLLIIDDGSTDGSLGYLRSVNDRRIRLYAQPNRGLTATLNRTLELTSTPWLVRHDADDIAYPDRLRRTVEFIRRHPDAGMFYSEADYFSRELKLGAFRTTKGTPRDLREITRAGYLLAICHPAVTLNVAKTRALGGYRFDLYVEDIDLWWRMALAHDVQFVPHVGVGVRHNAGSTSDRHLARQSLNALFIQYLLLASLSGVSPRPYQDVYPILEALLDCQHLALRKHLREVNIHLSQRRYLRASSACCRAFMSAPLQFARRVSQSVRPTERVTNGLPPLRLSRACARAWPDHDRMIQVFDLTITQRKVV